MSHMQFFRGLSSPEFATSRSYAVTGAPVPRREYLGRDNLMHEISRCFTTGRTRISLTKSRHIRSQVEGDVAEHVKHNESRATAVE